MHSTATDPGTLKTAWHLLCAAFPTETVPSLGSRCLTARLPLASSDAQDLRTRLEGAGATVYFSGETLTRLNTSAALMLCGVLGGCSFSARIEGTDDGAAMCIQLQLPSTAMEGPQAEAVEAAYHVCDQLFGGDKTDPELISGYLAHQLLKMSKKARGRMLAELASVLADHLHDIAD